jgi:hypothetical protein
MIPWLDLIRSKKIIGNDGLAAIGDLGFSTLSEVLNNFERIENKEIGDDSIEIFRFILSYFP